MPTAVVAAAAWFAAASVAVKVATVVALATIVGMTSKALVKALMPDVSAANKAANDQSLSSSATPNERMIVGKAVVSGTIIKYEKVERNGEEYHHLFVPLATHPCEAVEPYQLDGAAMTSFTGNGYYIQPRLGNQTSVLARALSSMSNVDSTFVGYGVTDLYVEMKIDPDIFPNGLQDLKVLVSGKRFYDPRKDSTVGGDGVHRIDDDSTWEWTDNPALILFWWKAFGDSIELPLDMFDLANIAEEANICDELVDYIDTDGQTKQQKRYTCNGTIDLTSEHEAVEDQLLTCAGAIWHQSGAQYRLQVAAYRGPAELTIRDEHLNAAPSRRPTVSLSERCNKVKASFISKDHFYQSTDMTPITSAFLRDNRDNGQVFEHDLQFMYTNDDATSQRLGNIHLNRNAAGDVVSLELTSIGLRCTPGRVINLQLTKQGITGLYEVETCSFDMASRSFKANVRETSSAMYEQGQTPAIQDLSPNSVIDNTLIAPVFDIKFFETAQSYREGYLTWKHPVPSSVVDYEIVLFKTAEGVSSVQFGPKRNAKTTHLDLSSLDVGSYEAHIVAINAFGKRSQMDVYNFDVTNTHVDAINKEVTLSGPRMWVVDSDDTIIGSNPITMSVVFTQGLVELGRGTYQIEITKVLDQYQFNFSVISQENCTSQWVNENSRSGAILVTHDKGYSQLESFLIVTDGAGQSSGITPIYATSTAGANASFEQGSRTFVHFYEWTDEAPTSIPTGLTYVDLSGTPGTSSGVVPIYASNSSGADASFTQGAREFVNFYEWVGTKPSTVPNGLTYFKVTGSSISVINTSFDGDGNIIVVFSDGSSITIPRGGDGASNGVTPIYATNSTGTNASFDQGSRTFVHFYEWTGSAPTSIPTGLTYVDLSGTPGTSSGVVPIYASNSSGADASFTQGAREFVNFYEWVGTKPSTVPNGLTYLKITGNAISVVSTTIDSDGNTVIIFSDGSSVTIAATSSDGTSGITPVYATSSTGTNASFDQGSRTFVHFYEWTGSAPTSIPTGLTYVDLSGAPGTSSGVVPIYASNSSGTNASFTQGSREFVNFYEWVGTKPSTVPNGLVYLKITGEQGPPGPPGPPGTDSPDAYSQTVSVTGGTSSTGWRDVASISVPSGLGTFTLNALISFSGVAFINAANGEQIESNSRVEVKMINAGTGGTITGSTKNSPSSGFAKGNYFNYTFNAGSAGAATYRIQARIEPQFSSSIIDFAWSGILKRSRN